MKRLLLIGACCALASLSCGGCDDSSSTTNDGSAGEACSRDDDCSGTCDDGVCVDGGTNNGPGGTNNSGGTNNRPGANNGPGGDAWDPDQTREEYCMGSGPPVVVGDQGGTTTGVCTGDIAQTTFRFALCVCEDYSSSGALTTDSFDSSQGA